MPNPYFTNNTDLLPNTRARAGDVESKLEAVEAGFDAVDVAITGINNSKAPVNSPVFAGDPKAPTPPDGDNDTSLATTEFTQRAISQAAAINLPSVAGNDGKVLTVQGGLPVWGSGTPDFLLINQGIV